MENNTFAKHPTFYAIGLSYKKADAEMRGKFSLDEQAKVHLLHQAKAEGIDLAIRMIDLTTLEGMDTKGKIKSLCAKAKRPDPLDPSVPSVVKWAIWPDSA